MAPWRRLLAIPPRSASLASLGFTAGDADVRDRLEKVLRAFLLGYNRCLEIDDPELLADTLRAELDVHHVGFAFEGAGMGCALLDLLAPWRKGPGRLRAFLDGAGREHDYIAAVGAGLALARLPWGRLAWPSYVQRLDPLIAWCLPDGYGFHEGLFHAARYLDGRNGRSEPPAWLPAFARQLFDSGLGRSLWWSQGAEPRRIARVLDGFAPERRPEMWCGVGVAASYAGGIDDGALLTLSDLAGPCRNDFLSGIPFATRMRQKGRNPSPVTDRACELLLGCTAGEASDWIVETVERVLADGSVPREIRLRDSYLLVRRRLVEELSSTNGGLPCRVRQPTTASF